MTESRTETREAILQSARKSVETNGFNALSFRDLASAVGVKSASVHYHFPTKSDLAEALVDRRCADQETFFENLFARIQNYDELMKGYIAMFRSAFAGSNRMCLAGVMSTEISGLPDRVRAAIGRFKDLNVEGISRMLRIRHPRMRDEAVRKRALAIFASLEGAQLIAHGLGGDVGTFDDIIEAYAASGFYSLNNPGALSAEHESDAKGGGRKPPNRRQARH